MSAPRRITDQARYIIYVMWVRGYSSAQISYALTISGIWPINQRQVMRQIQEAKTFDTNEPMRGIVHARDLTPEQIIAVLSMLKKMNTIAGRANSTIDGGVLHPSVLNLAKNENCKWLEPMPRLAILPREQWPSSEGGRDNNPIDFRGYKGPAYASGHTLDDMDARHWLNNAVYGNSTDEQRKLAKFYGSTRFAAGVRLRGDMEQAQISGIKSPSMELLSKGNGGPLNDSVLDAERRVAKAREAIPAANMGVVEAVLLDTVKAIDVSRDSLHLGLDCLSRHYGIGDWTDGAFEARWGCLPILQTPEHGRPYTILVRAEKAA